MSNDQDRPVAPKAVLVSGVFGSGKTSVIEEMAELMEAHHLAYAAIDLDWLWWYSNGIPSPEPSRAALVANLSAVARNYRELGVLHFLLALFVSSQQDIDELEGALEVPLTVVRLHASYETIEARLRTAATSGRVVDLARAAEALEHRVGDGLEDFSIANEGPLSTTAHQVLEQLGWLDGAV